MVLLSTSSSMGLFGARGLVKTGCQVVPVYVSLFRGSVTHREGGSTGFSRSQRGLHPRKVKKQCVA